MTHGRDSSNEVTRTLSFRNTGRNGSRQVDAHGGNSPQNPACAETHDLLGTEI